MINKLLKFVQSPAGDTVVFTKADAIKLLQYQQQLEMNSMLSEVLVNSIMLGEIGDIKIYVEQLTSDTEFMVKEFTRLRSERETS